MDGVCVCVCVSVCVYKGQQDAMNTACDGSSCQLNGHIYRRQEPKPPDDANGLEERLIHTSQLTACRVGTHTSGQPNPNTESAYRNKSLHTGPRGPRASLTQGDSCSHLRPHNYYLDIHTEPKHVAFITHREGGQE